MINILLLAYFALISYIPRLKLECLTLLVVTDVRFLLKMHDCLIIYTFVRLTILAHGDAVPQTTAYP